MDLDALISQSKELREPKKKPLTKRELAKLKAELRFFEKTRVPTLRPILSSLFILDGNPYTLDNHAPFEPLFRTRIPKVTVVKAGRQIGKCRPLSASETIYAANGRPLLPADLRVGLRVLALDENLRWTTAKIVAKHENPPDQIIRIKTRLGADFSVSATHGVRQVGCYRPAAELNVGDRVAALRRGGEFGHATIARDRIILVAYLIGDGSCATTGYNISFTSECSAVLNEYSKVAGRLTGYRPKRYRKKSGNAFDLRYSKCSRIGELLLLDDLLGKYAWEKRLPSWVFNLPKKETILFLSRLWATDGWISRPQKGKMLDIAYSTSSKLLSRDVRALLLKLGIPSSIKQKRTGYKKNGKFHQCRDAYVVRIETRDGWASFMRLCKVPGKPAVKLPRTKENNNRDTIPFDVQELLDALVFHTKNKHDHSLQSCGLRSTIKYPLSRNKARAYLDYFEMRSPHHPRLHELRNLVEGDVLWDEIESITHQVEPETTWDIEVTGDHNYVLDGVVTHNSTILAALGITRCNTIKHFKLLTVTPLFEQIRRFSTNYVEPFINDSPIRTLMVDSKSNGSVLQKTFRNRSMMLFSFCFRDANRTRGVSAGEVNWDEIQNMDSSLIGIVNQVMAASPWGIELYAGTPLTLDNTLEGLWLSSSQAEWEIPCEACHYRNIPSLTHDLEKMIGPYHPDIGPRRPGTICAKCEKPVDPRNGYWIHEMPDKRWSMAGYHTPQVIFPMHYASREKWAELLSKRNGAGNMTQAMFHNEICGESSDHGAKLITQTDLKRAACLPHKNILDEARLIQLGDYIKVILSVDWGAVGERFQSFSTYSVLGMLPDGKIDVLFGYRSLTPSEHVLEAQVAARLMSTFRCSALVHDYTGAGSLRETFLIHTGIPVSRIMPIAYVRAAFANILTYKIATEKHPKDHWQVDKARSLLLTCQQIKNCEVRFFQYDYRDKDNAGLLHDFLSLIEEKIPTRFGKEAYTIGKNPLQPDDFAQSVNMGCVALWHINNRWPNLANAAKFALEGEFEAWLEPKEPQWDGDFDIHQTNW